MIEALLPRTRRAVLALLFSRPDEAFYQRQIVRATEGGKGAVERELRSLTNAGILIREKRGNSVYYRANPGCPVFADLRQIVLKTTGLADIVREALNQVEGIDLAFIFGSMAKGTADAKSDVDVLIVGEASFADIAEALHTAQERVGREVTPTVYSPEEFRQKIEEGHHFLTRVLSEPKILLIGTTDDLDRVGRPAS